MMHRVIRSLNRCNNNSGLSSFRYRPNYITATLLNSHRHYHDVLAGVNPLRAGPSTTTTVQLLKLGNDITESSLKNILKDVKCRKIEIEPGFSVHVSNEAEAMYSRSLLKDKLNCDGNILSTYLPALLLNNVPSDINACDLLKSFPKSQKIIVMGSGAAVQIPVKDADIALKASKDIEEIAVNGQKLKANIIKLDNKFIVTVFNFHTSVKSDEVESKLSSILCSKYPDFKYSVLPPIAPTVTLRYTDTTQSQAQSIVSKLSKLAIDGKTVIDGKITSKELKMPALLVRSNKGYLDDDAIKQKLQGMTGLKRIQLQRRAPDLQADVAVAYFNSEEDCIEAHKKMKGAVVNDRKVHSSVKAFTESAVKVSNLPPNYNIIKVKELFAFYKPARVTMDMSTSSAVVVMNSPKDADLACRSIQHKVIDGNRLAIDQYNIHDVGIEFDLPLRSDGTASFDIDAFATLLEKNQIKPLAVTRNTNVRAFIGFKSVEDASTSHAKVMDGSVALLADTSAGVVASTVSAMPSFTVELIGLGADVPTREGLAVLESNNILTIGVDRSAIIKFKRHSDIVPGMKQLEQILSESEAKGCLVRRYRNIISDGTTAYDNGDLEESFDKFSLQHLLKDYLKADPATRYQIAKNAFEVHLNDAIGMDEIGTLLDTAATKDIKVEAKALLSKGDGLTPEDKKRLFDLFLQRDDMARFVADFKDMEALLGPADESDEFDWSTYRVENGEDLDRQIAALRNAEVEGERQFIDKAQGKGKGSKSKKGHDITVIGDDGKENRIKLDEKYIDNPYDLTDKDGRVWSGVILDTDMVQKTMPGNRMSSHRALVSIGNFRGAGGFGMGKGKTSTDAINSAFREALRSLIYIDLYDSFGFAHDLYGKHNSCHAYVKATPKSRMMIGSAFAEEVLSRFGVSSASVKLVGRRDPYAMVRALFNALQTHENIDEFAKDRGKRYLTVKWAYDNKI